MVLSRFAETRFAETLTITVTLNPNFGESGFGKSLVSTLVLLSLS